MALRAGRVALREGPVSALPSLQSRVVKLDNARYHGGVRVGAVRAIVWHCTAGDTALSAIEWMNRPNVPSGGKAGYHYLIDKPGTIYRHTPTHLVAYHAGASSWPAIPAQGHSLNYCTLGVSFANDNGSDANAADDALTAAQWESARWLGVTLMKAHGVPPAMNLAHREIAPGRKTDPLPRILPMDPWRAELGRLLMGRAA